MSQKTETGPTDARMAAIEVTNVLLRSPMVTWQECVEQYAPGFQHEMIRDLDGLIERAARLRGYMDERYGHGYGDHGHKDGVKSSNKLAAKIRKALGFTYARQDVNF